MGESVDFQYNPTAPLERAPGETHAAWLALCDYAALGASRSLSRLLERYKLAPGASPTRRFATLKAWSTRYSWQARVAASDSDLIERERLQAESVWLERQRLHREESWALHDELLRKARAMLEFPLADVQKTERRTVGDGGQVVIEEYITVKPARWSFRDAAALVDVASKLARQAAYLAPVGDDSDLTPEQLAALSDEELAALAESLERRRAAAAKQLPGS